VTQSAKSHLDLIHEILLIAEPDCELWLRGGWAVDFFVGDITRDHVDIDFFAWHDSAATLTQRLIARGFDVVPGPPVAQQRDFAKNGIDVSFALVARNEKGDVIVAGGPWAGAEWPGGMLDGPTCTLHGVTCRVISPQAQIEIKEMTPVWIPGRPVRQKDQVDVRRLEARLTELRIII
jgi:hypothetical protein